MSRLPTRFYPPFLEEPHTRLPPALRNWLGSLLQGPPRGPRRRHRQICVLALGRIGDFVLSLSAFRLFARKFGADQFTLVVPAALTQLAARELPGVELITLPPEAGALFREILPIWRRERGKFATDHFARKVTLNHFRPFYHEIARSWIDAATDCRLEPSTYPAAMLDGQCRELQAHRLVASAALERTVTWEEILPVFTQFPSGDDGRLLVYPLSHDGTRSIPLVRIVAILRLWRTRSQAPIILGGSPRDLGELERYAAACHAAGLDRIAVETPAGVLAFIEHLAAAGAVLAADSAAGHVGGAFDKPTIVLMSVDWHGLSQPWSRSPLQRVFLHEDEIEAVVAALPAL